MTYVARRARTVESVRSNELFERTDSRIRAGLPVTKAELGSVISISAHALRALMSTKDLLHKEFTNN